MTKGQQELPVFVVVEVWRGIAAGAKIFTDAGQAERYARRAQRRCNALEGDVQLFEDKVSLPPRTAFSPNPQKPAGGPQTR